MRRMRASTSWTDHRPRTIDYFRTVLVEEWAKIPQSDIDRLIRIMPNRSDECMSVREELYKLLMCG